MFPTLAEQRAIAKNENWTPDEYLSHREEKFHKEATELYQERLLFNVAKEQARKDLPLSTYTEVIWKCDLHNILHYFLLRMDHHAQKEIRDFANALSGFVSELWPITWEAFLDYKFHAMSFSRQELVLLREIINSNNYEVLANNSFINKREAEAFKNKIKKVLMG